MDKKPLLILPLPAEKAIRPGTARPKKYKSLAPKAIYTRFKKQFKKLGQDLQVIQVQDGIENADPEKTLVLLSVGGVQDLHKALEKVGIESLEEAEGDEIEGDDLHQHLKERDRRKALKTTVYLTAVNQASLARLLRIWKQYKKDPENYRFVQGTTKLRDLFALLHDLRYWSIEDRLTYQESLQSHLNFLQSENVESINLTLELWYRKNLEKSQKAENKLTTMIEVAGGSVVDKFRSEEIAYHAVVARLPISLAQEMLQSPSDDIELLAADEVMLFRPTGQCIDTDEHDGESDELADSDDPFVLEDDKPVVALLDGLPMEQHQALAGRLLINDANNVAAEYEPHEQRHGTEMASLIINGDISAQERGLPTPLYCHPIMAPGREGRDGVRREVVPEGVIPLKQVYLAVKQMFEGLEGNPPTAPTVRVVNLSVGDISTPFYGDMSPWARMLDYLATKYSIVFVVSAGNVYQDVVLEMTNEDYKTASDKDIADECLRAMYATRGSRRLLSPAESINAITVGATQQDACNEVVPHNVNILMNQLPGPSPINPITYGYNKSIKPELLAPGGRVKYGHLDISANAPASLHILSSGTPPGLKVAAPGQQGTLNGTRYASGTSHAAAYSSRHLALIHDHLKDLFDNSEGEKPTREQEACLLKALHVHGARLDDGVDMLNSAFPAGGAQKYSKEMRSQFYGHGALDSDYIFGCLNNQATAIRSGNIKPEQVHEYSFPLPPSISSKTVKRRLVITLAWNTPIKPKVKGYRLARLGITTKKYNRDIVGLGDLEQETHGGINHKGSVVHQVHEGSKAAAFIENDVLYVEVSCKKELAIKGQSIPYVLAVTLETPSDDLPIYTEVEQGIGVLNGIRAGQVGP